LPKKKKEKEKEKPTNLRHPKNRPSRRNAQITSSGNFQSRAEREPVNPRDHGDGTRADGGACFVDECDEFAGCGCVGERG
jgi:hypothetical protein